MLPLGRSQSTSLPCHRRSNSRIKIREMLVQFFADGVLNCESSITYLCRTDIKTFLIESIYRRLKLNFDDYDAFEFGSSEESVLRMGVSAKL